MQIILKRRRGTTPSIDIVNAREHNLKGVNVRIPSDTFTVITGVSGSGKSTLAFDIIFNEGQRRYLESREYGERNIRVQWQIGYLMGDADLAELTQGQSVVDGQRAMMVCGPRHGL